MASIAGEQDIPTNNQTVEANEIERESREGSVEKRAAAAAIRDRDEKLKLARERQNEERQRKIEELKAQAEAAQRYREQKEEERRRRIEDMRMRDNEKRLQVEERKRAIMEAEKERREYILRKNQERESRLEAKKRDRSTIAFAFGSSTPRLLEPADFGMVSSSTFWGQRRSTSISNVAGVSLSRRSSERELSDSGAKKRATSASGTDRRDDYRRKTSSMYEVFNWGHINDEPPKRFSLSVVGSEINIDEPVALTSIPTSTSTATKTIFADTERRRHSGNIHASSRSHTDDHLPTTDYTTVRANNFKEDNIDASSNIVFRSVARRKTDLMPTIPTPRDGHHYGSRSSLSNTPRTPGRAFSMNRLDQLAKPIRRNGEHIFAILERERRERTEMMDETESLGGGGTYRRRLRKQGSDDGSRFRGSSGKSTTSRSMSHLAGTGTNHHQQQKYSVGGGISSSFRPLNNSTKDNCSRSGNVTPGGSSRPGSAMSTSTTFSNSATRRSVPIRKPRPASIAGTGVSLDEINKLKRESKPPLKMSSAQAHPATSAQTTPKRTNNLMSTSLIVTSSSSSLTNTPSDRRLTSSAKREPRPNSTPKGLPKTSSSERLNKLNKTPKDSVSATSSPMAKSAIVVTSTSSPAPIASNSKAAKNKSSEKKTTNAISTDSGDQVPQKTTSAITDVEVELIQHVPVEMPAGIGEQPDSNATTTNNTEIVETYEVAIEKQEEEISEKNSENIDLVNAQVVGNGTKENSETRDSPVVLSSVPPQLESMASNDSMTASMIARSKITTEEEAKAALAERRRLMREEAERQAELERQRLEAERLAELKRQEEEAERQRQFEEESIRLAEQQRRAEDERLRQAIEEAKQREEEERRKREEEERQRLEREEAEKKAKEEAEKQRIETAERLKREEKEREERRKRVEAIMSRTRKGGAAPATPNSTPSKDTNTPTGNAQQQEEQQQKQQQEQEQQTTQPQVESISSSPPSGESSSASASSTTNATTPTQQQSQPQPQDQGHQLIDVVTTENTQAVYEQSVIDKENALINSFSNMIIDENAKNLLQNQNPIEVTNGKLLSDFPNTNTILQNFSTTPAAVVANGNGHIENINNKNDINILQDVIAPTTATTTNQLIDLNLESQDINNVVNFNNNNNNSLLATTTATTANTLVNADSHENTDISLL